MRKFCAPLLCGVMCVAITTPTLAQNKAAKAESITTRGGVQLHLTYWESPNGKESPVIVLLHGEGGNRKKWEPTGARLQKAGYSVIAVDLRKHGDSMGAPEPGATSNGVSLKPGDYLAMIADDMEAVKGFMMQKHHAGEFNVRKTGLVAIGSMGAVALNFAGNDWLRKPYPDGPTPAARTPRGQDVQTVTLISPDANVKGVKTTDAIRLLKAAGVSFLVIAGTKDADKKKSADKIFKSLESGLKREKEKRMFYEKFPLKLNGEDLVRNYQQNIQTLLLRFNDQQLKPIEQPWRDRQNKLNKP